MRTPASSAPDSLPLANDQVAHRLDEVAALLEDQHANPFRVRAYREAARMIRGLDRSLHAIIETEGLEGVDHLPGIGTALARAIEQLVFKGSLGLLDRLRGASEPEQLLATVPGVGPELACRAHQQLGIETLEDLEQAAHDGRLQRVPGFGAKRVRGIRESLAGRLRQRRLPTVPPPSVDSDTPSVDELLDVDREYGEAVQADRLPRIAPRRFNPLRKAWLPVLHTHRNGRHYTALYSNTARAHELGTAQDWVVIYRDDHDGHGQWTVVTARAGPLRGERVVRGREGECARYYQTRENPKLPLWTHREE
jgi:hypothetical protein